MPSATRPGSFSTRYSGSGCGMTRTCHVPSGGHVRMLVVCSTLPGSNGQGNSPSPVRSRCPLTTQLCDTGSRRISMNKLSCVPCLRVTFFEFFHGLSLFPQCAVVKEPHTAELAALQANFLARRAILVISKMPDDLHF